MTRKHILIVTDSRGRGLQPFLASRISRQLAAIQVDVLPGATLETITAHLQSKIDRNTDLTIIAGGICNFTQKCKENNEKLLAYHRTEGKVEHVKDLLVQVAGELQGKLAIATIPPASLKRYYTRFNNKEPPAALDQQQKELLQDIAEVNRDITTINKAANLKVIDLHTQCFSNSLDRKKKNRSNTERRRKIFNEHLLPDGVHPNSTLEHKWFSRYEQAINSWLQSTSSSDTESDAAAADDWDYKRYDPNAPPRPSTSQQ